jgi:hypothetical protein
MISPESMLFSCQITKTTIDTHTNSYVLPIAFPLQEWLQEGTSLLRYNTLSCLRLHLAVHNKAICEMRITRENSPISTYSRDSIR